MFYEQLPIALTIGRCELYINTGNAHSRKTFHLYDLCIKNTFTQWCAKWESFIIAYAYQLNIETILFLLIKVDKNYKRMI